MYVLISNTDKRAAPLRLRLLLHEEFSSRWFRVFITETTAGWGGFARTPTAPDSHLLLTLYC